MQLIGHRGCGGVHPENTIKAFDHSSEELSAVEVDLRRCKSGEIVCIHDATVDRVTDSTGVVSKLSYSSLQELSVQGSGLGIPKFETVVNAVSDDTVLQIELKEKGLMNDVLSHIDPDGSYRFSSFSTEILAVIANLDFNTGYLFDDGVDRPLDMASKYNCQNVHPHWTTCINTEVINQAHKRGFQVYAWGVKSDRDALRSLRQTKVDGATVNSPDL